MPPIDIVLYTRRNCCLCDEAKTLLEKYNVLVREVDIDADPELRQRYDQCVPVVAIDGQERFRGRINEVLLRRLLQTPRPSS